MDDRFIKLALDVGLLNYVDHETPRRYFINGNAEQEDVAKFAELVVWETRQEFANKIERLRDALRKIYDVTLSDMDEPEMFDWAIDIARVALKESE